MMARSTCAAFCFLAFCMLASLSSASADRLTDRVVGRALQQAVPVAPLAGAAAGAGGAAAGAGAVPVTPTGCQDIPPPPGDGSGGPTGVIAATGGVSPNALSALQAAQANPSLGSVIGLLNSISNPGPFPGSGGVGFTGGGFTCAQQKSFGQCNAGFMKPELGRNSFCAITCGRCK